MVSRWVERRNSEGLDLSNTGGGDDAGWKKLLGHNQKNECVEPNRSDHRNGGGHPKGGRTRRKNQKKKTKYQFFTRQQTAPYGSVVKTGQQQSGTGGWVARRGAEGRHYEEGGFIEIPIIIH